MRRLIGPTLVVTLLGLAGQGLSFVLQMVMASTFGAGSEMDAYLAAITLPTYATSVLFSSVGYVLVPTLISLRAEHGEERARRLAGSALGLYILSALILSTLGAVFARPLLTLVASGLPDSTLETATRVSWIVWPAGLLNGGSLLVTAICHAREEFRRPAVAPILGIGVNLAVLSILGNQLGADGLAIAALSGAAVQLAMLLTLARRDFLGLNTKNRDLEPSLRVLRPLVGSALVGQAYAPIERGVAASLGPGTIPQIGYAGRLNMALAALVSGGISVTLFPTMSRHSAARDNEGLRESLGLGLRITWALVAPVVAIGSALAYPLIHVVLERGAFTARDTANVAAIFPVYLVSLVGLAQANVTARALYAIKQTGAVLRIAIIETSAYAIAAFGLSYAFGIQGLVAAWAMSTNLSFAMQAWVLRSELGGGSFTAMFQTVLRVGVAACVGALIARFVGDGLHVPAGLTVIIAGITGFVSYVVALLVLRAPELSWLIKLVRGRHR